MDLNRKIIKELKSVKSWCGGVEQELLARSGNPEFPIASLPRLTDKMWGLRKGLNVIASRTSQGKSALVKQICWDTARAGLPTVLLSLEDDVPKIVEDMFCMVKQINSSDLMRGHFSFREEYKAEWKEFVSEIPKSLIISNGIGSTFEELNHLFEMLEPKPKIIVVDYIQAIKATSKQERENLNEYIREFRALCLKNNMAGILVSQMNRMAVMGEGEPSLENLKSTGVLEEHADMVLILLWEYFHKHDERIKNDYTIIVAKNKRGRIGRHKLRFYPENFRFGERPDEEEKQEELIEKAFA